MIKKFFRKLLGRKAAADIGEKVPSNLKFWVLVAIALFWADFLKVIFEEWVLAAFGERTDFWSTLLVALVATVVGLVVLESYRRIRHWLEEVRVK